MAATTTAAPTPSFDDFEPLCNWLREEGRETLVVHVPDFKKEELNLHMKNVATLKIFGERPVDVTKRSRFYKEIIVPNDCNTNDIRAKLIGDSLHIIIPRKSNLVSQNLDEVMKKPLLAGEKVVISENANVSGNPPTDLAIQKGSLVSRMFGKVPMSVAVAVAATLGAYVLYFSSNVQN